MENGPKMIVYDQISANDLEKICRDFDVTLYITQDDLTVDCGANKIVKRDVQEEEEEEEGSGCQMTQCQKISENDTVNPPPEPENANKTTKIEEETTQQAVISQKETNTTDKHSNVTEKTITTENTKSPNTPQVNLTTLSHETTSLPTETTQIDNETENPSWNQTEKPATVPDPPKFSPNHDAVNKTGKSLAGDQDSGEFELIITNYSPLIKNNTLISP